MNVLHQKIHNEIGLFFLFKKDVFICFLEYEKAFDRVRHEPLMQCQSEIGVDGKDTQIIRCLYWDQTAPVRIMNELSDEIRIQRGVRQGCIRIS